MNDKLTNNILKRHLKSDAVTNCNAQLCLIQNEKYFLIFQNYINNEKVFISI